MTFSVAAFGNIAFRNNVLANAVDGSTSGTISRKS